ncbi:hypothetical protein [Parapedobacter pyrenivorans]|nr:hypothetical protein [Parapedobacter pyrenivorans]
MKQAIDNNSESRYAELLQEIDISIAISYFGSTELLDNIGLSTIEQYLAICREDGIRTNL